MMRRSCRLLTEFQFFFLLILCLDFSIVNAGEISFQVAIEKDKYLIGEDILIVFKVRNDGLSPLSMQSPDLDCGAVMLNILDKNGDTIRYNGRILGTPMKETIRENDSLVAIQSLIARFGFDEPDQWFLRSLPKGSYRFVATYYPNSDRNGAIVSDPIMFTIDDPIGNESRAFKLFMSGKRSYWKFAEGYAACVEYFGELIDRCQFSVYRPEALFLLGEVSGKHGDSGKANYLWEKLLLDSPNSFYTVPTLNLLVSHKSTLREKITFLQKKAEKSSNTFLRYYSQYLLNSLNRK